MDNLIAFLEQQMEVLDDKITTIECKTYSAYDMADHIDDQLRRQYLLGEYIAYDIVYRQLKEEQNAND